MKILSQIAELFSTIVTEENYITTNKLDDWTSFIVKFNKSYENFEELQNRKEIFHQNKEFIKNHSQFLAVNQFMDLTLEEYQEKILKTKLMAPPGKRVSLALQRLLHPKSSQ